MRRDEKPSLENDGLLVRSAKHNKHLHACYELPLKIVKPIVQRLTKFNIYHWTPLNTMFKTLQMRLIFYFLLQTIKVFILILFYRIVYIIMHNQSSDVHEFAHFLAQLE